jgi:manganese-dependent ADP-ribose/CDP-alcohol diphosphatase
MLAAFEAFALLLVAWLACLIWSRAQRLQPVCTFGLVADPQGGDLDDKNSDNRTLFYRRSVPRLEAAVAYWRRVRGLRCVLSLGDIVEGNVDAVSTRRDRGATLAAFGPLRCPVRHVVGNHCLKFTARGELLGALGLVRGSYRHDLGPGWRLLVLDTTDLSLPSRADYVGWPEGSAEYEAASAYYAEHEGEPRMKKYNGGVGAAQFAWLRAELRDAEAAGVRLIVASHHPLAPGACRETHRSWTGTEVAALLAASPAFALALAGHDHPGGSTVWRGKHFVTVEAMLEARPGGNAFAVVRILRDGAIDIDGCGTAVRDRRIPAPC